MNNERKLIQFHFITNAEVSTHYHQNLELFYVLTGTLEIKIDDQSFLLKKGDLILINANKRHDVTGDEEFLGVRFEIDFHMLAEYMGSMQLLFWCNTVVDKNDAYDTMRGLMDRILDRYFEKDEKSALHLSALYYELAYVLTSSFLIKSDNTKLNMIDTQDQMRIREIQSYIQANYQTQISLNDLAGRLYLSNAYLSKYIKKNLGLTFMEYLNNVRLFHAVDELLYSRKNMTRIALDNGFPTSAAFTKAFKDVYGEAPSEYRKRVEESVHEKSAETNHDEDPERIRRFLDYKKAAIHQENSKEKVIHIDTEKEISRLSDCSKAVCIGDAYTILQSEVQKQLKDLQSASGIRYARIWNIFSKEECFNEKEGCNFRKIDLVIDFLLENNMKPYLELGHKLTVFMYNPEKYLKQIHQSPSYDEETFERIVNEFCMHLADRYGVDEMETWFFEYWSSSDEIDQNNRIEMSDGSYFRRFDALYRAAKKISPNISVGGAGFILGYEMFECREVLQRWKERKIHPDFLSVYSYQYVAIEDEGKKYGRKSIDIDYMKNQTAILKEIMKETGFEIPRIHISEWNFTISNRNVLNDGCQQGAYILKNCIDMNGEVEVMAYWHALDSYSDYYDADMPLNGDSGMISRDGICKPSYYAYEFMNKLLPNVLCKDSHSIVTSNGRDRYVIACHNFKKLSSHYVFTEEDKINYEDIDRFTEDSDPLNLQFCLENVKNGNYSVKIHYVNREKGSVQDIWKRLGYYKNLARDEMNYLKKSAIPWMEIQNVYVENGVLELKNILKEEEIRLIEIQYRYMA